MLAVVGVAVVLALWSTMESARSGDAATAPPPASSHGAGGMSYETPSARLGSSGVVVVEQPVRAPEGDGVVEVPAPELTLVVDGEEVAALPKDDARESFRTRGGGLVAFTASFSADTGSRMLVVGDEVTVRLIAADGSVVDATGIEIEDGRRRVH